MQSKKGKSEKKRVCIFSAQYLPSSYGVEKYTFHLAQYLSKKEVEVTIVTSDLYGAPKYEKDGLIEVYRLPSYGLMKNRLPFIKYNREFRKKIKKIFEKEYDLCITNTRFYLLSLVGTILGRKYAKRNILIEHGTAHIEMSNVILNYVGEIYEHILVFLEKKNVKEFYGVSKDCNKWLKHFRITPKGTIHNAIDKNEIDSISETEIWNQLGDLSGKVWITFTGRLIQEKGILQLIGAVERLEKKYPELRLIIAGDGPLMPQLREMCKNNVILLGRVSFEDVITILRKSDIFCFPSVYAEGMPTSLLEAAVCKNSIISTACGGAREIIPEETYGVILKDNSEEEIANALEKLLEDDNCRKQTAQKVCQHVEANFVWEKIADKMYAEFLQ